MSLKTFFLKQFAAWIGRSVRRDAQQALADQQKILRELVRQAKDTRFGRDHNLAQVGDYEAFKKAVPLRDYEGLRPYIDPMIEGKPDMLWPGLPRYLAKTSGTTSGAKFIPLTKASIPNHFGTARNAVFNYVSSYKAADFLDGKMIFLSGSPELDEKNGMLVGRLSGISNHLVPSWIKGNQLPSYKTNCIEDWETKLDAIVDETLDQDLRLISGIPPWVQMYYERVLERTGKKTILEVFPNFSLFVYGGVNFEPYRAKLETLVGGRVPSIETYPASEGFIAFQDRQEDKGLLLNTNSGIFFEFVPAEEYFNENPTRLQLSEVKTGQNYAIILNTNAGLWGYSIGDTVEFVELNPYRIRVTGRIKHFISAFGEHVIGKEVDQAMLQVAAEENLQVIEYTVAPQVNPSEGGLPYHEWFVALDQEPQDLLRLEAKLDQAMQAQNIYYQDLITGKVLRPLRIRLLQREAFRDYMKSIGKLGGQNKVPRLSNDRKIAEALQAYLLH